ncbi:DUF4169 family protein [Azospirillum sp. ST 5-10]|uniref:DUF4169 family protein n=1 Tax=unclassified Azospirillum TaxID=2630922 RepID=UPI003F4A4AF2
MGEIVNLNRYRKSQARAQREKEAAENRVRFGRPKAETAAQRKERERADRALDAKKRDDPA